MSNYSQTRTIHSSKDLEEHFRAVEAYIAGDDPETLFLRRVSHIADESGPEALSKLERTYLAMANFFGAAVSGQLSIYFQRQPEALLSTVADGLAHLGRADLVPAYQALQRCAKAPLIAKDSEVEKHGSQFVFEFTELNQALLEWGEVRGLF